MQINGVLYPTTVMGKNAKGCPFRQRSVKQTQPTRLPCNRASFLSPAPGCTELPPRLPCTVAICVCIYACPSCCRDHRCCCYSCCSPALRNWRCRRQGCSKGASYSQRRLSESGGVVTTAVRVWNSLWNLAEKEGRQERWRWEREKKVGSGTYCLFSSCLPVPTTALPLEMTSSPLRYCAKEWSRG